MKYGTSTKWLLAVLCGWTVLATGCAQVQLSEDTQQKFAEYQTQAYPDFKAFAFEPDGARWGIGFATRTPERAMAEALAVCGKTGVTCALYAVGPTVVVGKSQPQIASLARSYMTNLARDLDKNPAGKRLTAAEIKFHLAGKTIKGTTVAGLTFIARNAHDGTVTIRLVDTKRQPLGKAAPQSDQGTWWVKDDMYCRQFARWFDREEACLNIVKDGKIFKFYTGNRLIHRAMIITDN